LRPNYLPCWLNSPADQRTHKAKVKAAAMTWDAATWITIAKVALWFIAGTGLIATFAILVGNSKDDDEDR
jgi:hypothetical protein